MEDPPRFATENRLADVPVLTVAGELDMASAPELELRLMAALGAGRGGLVLDLAQVTFMDSTALTALVNALERFESVAGRLVLVATDPRLRALLEVAGMHDGLEMYATRDDALAAVTSPRERAASD